MSFEKEFPELKGKNIMGVEQIGMVVDAEVTDKGLVIKGTGEVLFKSKDIQKHCLSKENVREVINYYKNHMNGKITDSVCNSILKELGLEEK